MEGQETIVQDGRLKGGTGEYRVEREARKMTADWREGQETEVQDGRVKGRMGDWREMPEIKVQDERLKGRMGDIEGRMGD